MKQHNVETVDCDVPRFRDDVHDMQVPFHRPPTKQTAIAEVLTDMDAELAALEQRRDKTRALKQAMMQELLTGRTRLLYDRAITRVMLVLKPYKRRINRYTLENPSWTGLRINQYLTGERSPARTLAAGVYSKEFLLGRIKLKRPDKSTDRTAGSGKTVLLD